MTDRLKPEHQRLAEDYHDTCWNWKLSSFIDDPVELRRLNKHRGSDISQEELNAILREALRMRKEGGENV